MRVLFMALVLLALPVTANAQNQDDAKSGIYFELRGGLNYLSDSDISPAGFAGIDAEAQFDAGYMIEGAAGYEHSSGFRGEIAIGYRNNDIDDASVSGAINIPSVTAFCSNGGFECGGDVEAVSFMANVYYGFDVGGGFKPFVGVGLGGANVDAELVANVPGGGSISGHDDDTVFAYQAIAGIEYVFPTDLADIALGGRYVYFATDDPEFTIGGIAAEAEYSSHSFLVGVRIIR